MRPLFRKDRDWWTIILAVALVIDFVAIAYVAGSLLWVR